MITGVGGTGVVTVGALVTMAAHLEAKGSSVLDFTGFAQKFGPVLSFVRIASSPDAINQVRIDTGAADGLIGCDVVVSSSPKASASYRPGMRAVVNLAKMPTGDIVRKRDADLAVDRRIAAIRDVAADLAAIDANLLAERLMGDAVFANVMMLGFAWQQGLVPVGAPALAQAIELNGVAVQANHRAFLLGRIAAAMPGKLAELVAPPKPKAETLDELVSRRVEFLTAYQDATYAGRYHAMVERVRAAEEAAVGAQDMTLAVAKSLFKLMAYKDEYEVARLHTQTGFADRLKQEFDGDFRIVHHLAPPFMNGGTDARGRPLKRRFGPWIRAPFHVLARLRRLRGTAFDPFGYTAERRMERELIEWYEGMVDDALGRLSPKSHLELPRLLALPMQIRGYGPVKEEAVRRVRAEAGAMRSHDDLGRK